MCGYKITMLAQGNLEKICSGCSRNYGDLEETLCGGEDIEADQCCPALRSYAGRRALIIMPMMMPSVHNWKWMAPTSS